MNTESVQSEIKSNQSYNYSSTRFYVKPTNLVTSIESTSTVKPTNVTSIEPTSTIYTSKKSSTININNLENKSEDKCEDKYLSSLSDKCDNFQDYCEDSDSKKICVNKTSFIAGTAILSTVLIVNTILCLLFASYLQRKKVSNINNNNKTTSYVYSLYSDNVNNDNDFKKYIRYLKRNEEVLFQNYKAHQNNENYVFTIEKTEQTSNTKEPQDSDIYTEIEL